ncbi:MAG: lytic murein transglycosylase B [Gammaproteobacteria bacterium]|nr:lytic murein transglycosylase B [Gammaproteobacteria bacterium]
MLVPVNLMREMMRIGLVLGVVGLLLYGPANADYAGREDVQAYIDELVSEHGFSKIELNEVFENAKRRQSIIDRMERPAERTLKWYEYRSNFITDTRIDKGVEFWASNEAALDAAEAHYNVSPEYIVAILGIETSFGGYMGSDRVLDALSTLAFDYPPRAEFFRNELTEFLLLVREEGRKPEELKGSYAGAMGYGQFIPSSYRAYAVDFDGDGLRDIWHNTTDAIGSVANYFHKHGWRGHGPVAVKVAVTNEAADELANQGLALEVTVSDLRSLGVEVADIEGDAKAALFRMEQRDGPEYWVGLHDFYVITRYNRSRLYALAVHQLSQTIKTKRSVSMTTDL